MLNLSEADGRYVFHIAESAVWTSAATREYYTPREYDEEGFIHLSYAGQVRGTASRYYAGRDDLVLLAIDRQTISFALKDENLLGGTELFPHLYAPLPVAAVTDVARVVWHAERMELEALV